jgi:hypothetical protein
MKELLITSGFPRSGNTYLNQALNLLYYPNETVNNNRHTVITIEKCDNKIMVPFRNPLDSIPSWQKFPSGGFLQDDVNFYIRFYSAVLDKINKVVLMDFQYFTQDIEYIKNKVVKSFDIDTKENITNSAIKQKMLANGKHKNLPQNNQEELLEIKTLLPKVLGFQECFVIYEKLQQKAI